MNSKSCVSLAIFWDLENTDFDIFPAYEKMMRSIVDTLKSYKTIRYVKLKVYKNRKTKEDDGNSLLLAKAGFEVSDLIPSHILPVDVLSHCVERATQSRNEGEDRMIFVVAGNSDYSYMVNDICRKHKNIIQKVYVIGDKPGFYQYCQGDFIPFSPTTELLFQQKSMPLLFPSNPLSVASVDDSTLENINLNYNSSQPITSYETPSTVGTSYHAIPNCITPETGTTATTIATSTNSTNSTPLSTPKVIPQKNPIIEVDDVKTNNGIGKTKLIQLVTTQPHKKSHLLKDVQLFNGDSIYIYGINPDYVTMDNILHGFEIQGYKYLDYVDIQMADKNKPNSGYAFIRLKDQDVRKKLFRSLGSHESSNNKFYINQTQYVRVRKYKSRR